MKEHSILVGMLIVALVVSISASLITLSQLETLNQLSGPAAAATSSGNGTALLNITADITISLTTGNLNFGNGYVDPGAAYATLNSAGGGTTSGTWSNSTHNITVQNDGNSPINLTVMFDKKAGKGNESFMCADSYTDDLRCGEGFTEADELYVGSALDFSFAIDDLTAEPGSCNETTSLDPNYGANRGFGLINDTYTEYAACDCFLPNADNDSLALYMQVGVPADANGNKSSTVTFTSYVSGLTGCV